MTACHDFSSFFFPSHFQKKRKKKEIKTTKYFDILMEFLMSCSISLEFCDFVRKIYPRKSHHHQHLMDDWIRLRIYIFAVLSSSGRMEEIVIYSKLHRMNIMTRNVCMYVEWNYFCRRHCFWSGAHIKRWIKIVGIAL